MITIQLAEPQDAKTLAEIQKKTFNEDARQFQNKEEDGPPGYDSSLAGRDDAEGTLLQAACR